MRVEDIGSNACLSLAQSPQRKEFISPSASSMIGQQVASFAEGGDRFFLFSEALTSGSSGPGSLWDRENVFCLFVSFLSKMISLSRANIP